MDFHSTHVKQTPISTPLETQTTPNANPASKLASLLAEVKERKKEREIANRIDRDLYENLSIILRKERKSFKEWLMECAAKEVVSHGDGDLTYTLDHFQDPNFKACPAFFREKESWAKYYSQINQKQYQEIDQQLRMLLELHNAMYGKVMK